MGTPLGLRQIDQRLGVPEYERELSVEGDECAAQL